MRTFDGNLDAYHSLNKLAAFRMDEFSRRICKATTEEEIDNLLYEGKQYLDKQKELYGELGREMTKIMRKHWWEFWK